MLFYYTHVYTELVEITVNITYGFRNYSESWRKVISLVWHHHHTIFATSRKKVLDPNGPYVSMSQTKIRNYSLSVIFEFSLFVVCCLSVVYIARLQYFIQYYPKVARFLIFEKNVTKMKGICVC